MSRFNKTRIFRLVYWSTLQKDDINEPYGTSEYDDRKTVLTAKRIIELSKDIYKTEVWKRTDLMEREKIVEERNGNREPLSLKNSRMEN